MHRRDFLSQSLFGITAAAVPVTLKGVKREPIHRMLPAPSPHERGWPAPDFAKTFRDVPGAEGRRHLSACLTNWRLRYMLIRYDRDTGGYADPAECIAAFWVEKFEPFILANWNAAADQRAFFGLETAEGWMERERRDDFDVLVRVEQTEYSGGPHWPRA